MWRDDGWILLNHGSPDARYSGISKAMLDHMASRMRQRGLEWCQLNSSSGLTVLPFHLAAGFETPEGYLGDRTMLRKRLV